MIITVLMVTTWLNWLHIIDYFATTLIAIILFSNDNNIEFCEAIAGLNILLLSKYSQLAFPVIAKSTCKLAAIECIALK